MKLDNGIKIKFKKNPYNKGLLGVFINSPIVNLNDKEYTCGITFIGNEMKIKNLIRTEEGTSRIIEHLYNSHLNETPFHEQKISSWKKNLILYRMNLHPIIFKKFGFKRSLFDRRRTIQAFSVAIVGGVSYLLFNLLGDNWLKSFISDNIYIQAFLIFMSLISVMRLWRPFAIKKGISEKDIEDVANKVYDKRKEDEEIKNRSIF